MAMTVPTAVATDNGAHLELLDPMLISAEQTRLLYQYLWIALAFSTIVALILCLFQGSEVGHLEILTWLSLMLLVTFGRVILGLRFHKANPAAKESEVWRRWYIVGAALAGMAWGSAGILLFPDDSIIHQVFLAFVLGGMAAGAITTQAYAWTAILVFLCLCISPLVLRLLFEATPAGYAMSAMLLLHLLGLSLSARRSYTNNLQNIGLRLEAVHREAAISRFKLTLDQIHDCVFTINPDSLRYQYVNRGVIAQLGYDHEDLMRMTPVAIDLDYTEADYRAMCASLVNRRENSITFETRYRHKDGHEFDVETILQYIEPGGHHGRLVAVVRDVSQHKQVEQALIKARDAAQVAAQAKSQFLATMSHEIRTPMNGVLGMAELLSHTRLDARQQRQVETIKSSATLLINLINDILDFSRIDADKLELRYEVFDLELAIHEVVRCIAPQIGTKDLMIDVRYSPDIPRHLIGDEHYIRQILMNLVGNAVKFTDSGQILIAVKGVMQGSEVAIQIEVKDTGIGIPPHSREHLFEAFTQVDGSHSRRYGGTGLGLAISHALIDLMCGEIGVDSEPGVGSNFWIRLTLSAGNESLGVATDGLAGLTALLVGRESSYLETIAMQLDELGLETVRAYSGHSASRKWCNARKAGRALPFMLVDANLPADELATLEKTTGEQTNGVGSEEMALLRLTPVDHDFHIAESPDVETHLAVPIPLATLAETLIERIKLTAHREGAGSEAESSIVASEMCFSARVLLVENNKVNREVTTAMLEELGLEVIPGDNGNEAIEIYRSAHPDLVLMDGRMPEVDGYEAARRLRSYEQDNGFHTPIIAMTAHGFPEDHNKCLQAGIDDHIIKPFTIQKLNEVLCHWLNSDKQSVHPITRIHGSETQKTPVKSVQLVE